MADVEQTTTMPVLADDSPGNIRLVLTMGGIGLIAGILIVLAYQLTLPVITRNKAIALERAIFEVVPGARTKTAFQLEGDVLRALPDGEDAIFKYYACYGDAGELVGVALEASGQGFQDIIRVLYGYSPACRCIVGMKVLESKETPGLGDKIEKDAKFRANFSALDVQLGDDAATMNHPVELVKHGEKSEAWQVEAITGATISSRAIANILRESSGVAVPIVSRNLDVLEEGAE